MDSHTAEDVFIFAYRLIPTIQVVFLIILLELVCSNAQAIQITILITQLVDVYIIALDIL